MKQSIQILSFYRFSPITEMQVSRWAKQLTDKANELEIKGLLIIGKEGMNSTFSGIEEANYAFCKELQNLPGFEKLRFKESWADFKPFRIFKVHQREEIVTLGSPEIKPNGCSHSHLSPEDWDRILKQEDVTLIDTRNWYETNLGSFKGAHIPNIDEFREFPDWVKKQNFDPKKKVLMFCTGGIRCEKAQIAMSEMGFNEVYQLKDGILNYIEKYPNEEFEGECFVFDHRVALDQNLQASTTYSLCPHCGQPAKTLITCNECGTPKKVCEPCLEKDPKYHTCSKNCAYHWNRQHSQQLG